MTILSPDRGNKTAVDRAYSLDTIANGWNANVEARAYELASGIDVTYFAVIVPYIKSLFGGYVPVRSSVLDLGCGLGYLANEISSWGYDVQGIDIAKKAVDYARSNFRNLAFRQLSIMEASELYPGKYDVCVANMVLHNLGDIEDNLKAIHRLLKFNGKVIASIPHPKSWYQKHFGDDPSFDYLSPHTYELPFKIRGGNPHPAPIIYFHRPVECYAQLLEMSGFDILNSNHPIGIDSHSEDDLLFCVWQRA